MLDQTKQKLTVNVYRADVATIKKHYKSWGGFTAAVRNNLHQLAERLRAMESVMGDDEDNDDNDSR